MWMALGVVALLGAIVSVMLTITFAVKKDMKRVAQFLLLMSVCFLLFIVGIVNDSPTSPAAALTIEEQINATIVKAVKDKTNMGKPRIVEQRLNKGILDLVLHANENLTINMTKRGIMMASSDVFEPLFALPEINEISLVWQLTLVDTNGKENDSPVLRIRLKRETAEKIVWKNFDIDNYPAVADQYWEHNIFRK